MIKELAILLLGAAVLWGCDNTNARVEEYCGVYEGDAAGSRCSRH